MAVFSVPSFSYLSNTPTVSSSSKKRIERLEAQIEELRAKILKVYTEEGSDEAKKKQIDLYHMLIQLLEMQIQKLRQQEHKQAAEEGDASPSPKPESVNDLYGFLLDLMA